MSRNRKLLIGIVTFWPVVALVLFYAGIFSLAIMTTASQAYRTWGNFAGYFILFCLANGVLLIVLLVSYIRHVYGNGQIEPEIKLIWALVIFFGSIFAMPVYWYIYIWRDPA